MIAKISRGRHTYGLVRYLTGPGKSDEHTNPQVVGGSFGVLEGWQRDNQFPDWSRMDLATLATHLDAHAFGHLALQRIESGQPMLPTDEVTGEWEKVESDGFETAQVGRWEQADKRPHVVQVVISLRADEGVQSPERWQAIARDYVEGMGWAEGVRWAAFHHGVSRGGNDHIHLVISSVREDGTWIPTSYERRRSTALCRQLEERFGLARLKDQGAERGFPSYSAAEARRAERYAQGEQVSGPARTVTGYRQAPLTGRERAEQAVRMAATGARSEAEFVTLLRDSGVRVRPRFAAGGREAVVGYSVLIGVEESGKEVWCGGGRLARDLTLPQLRQRWEFAAPEAALSVWGAGAQTVAKVPVEPVPGWEREVAAGIWQAQQEWSRIGTGDVLAASRMSSDVAALLTAAGSRIDGRSERLVRAGREAARAAQLPGGQPRRGVVSSPHAGRAVRLMLAAAGKNDTAGWMAVLAQLAQLMRTIEEYQVLQRQRVAAQRAATARVQYITSFQRSYARAQGVALGAGAGDREQALSAAVLQQLALGRHASRPPQLGAAGHSLDGVATRLRPGLEKEKGPRRE